MIAPNPKVESEVDRLIAMARSQGWDLTTAESLRQRLLIEATRRDVEGSR